MVRCSRRRQLGILLPPVAALAALLVVLHGATPAASAADAVVIKVLSNRADVISGGDALVEVVVPDGVQASSMRIDVDGRDVTPAFAVRDDGRFLGLVTGLSDGANVLKALEPDNTGARITITNHPLGGPIFSGEQVQPWFCSTDGAGLGPPTDAQCNAPPKFSYQYKKTNGQFAAYNPSSPPTDVATTTTDQGVTVPYVVRVERGTADRGIYDFAVLFDPTQPWTPWAPQAAWNHKLYWLFGSSCSYSHNQGTPGSVINDMALSRGFMVAASSMTEYGQHCNDVTSTESVMMAKEHIAESYGSIRYTIGTGCSGGSHQLHLNAANYPGLLQGLLPSCTFQDTWTVGREFMDCALLMRYYTDTSPQLWTEAQESEVDGHWHLAVCAYMGLLRAADYLDPSDCGASWGYNAQTNPTGARCTLQDYQVGIWGRRPDGFAKSPLDNVGVTYGLAALRAGTIVPEHFVDLNEKVGCYDIDFGWQAQRCVADPGSVAIAYRSGRVVNGRELAKVADVDLMGGNGACEESEAEEHYDFRSFVIEARLLRDNGNTDSQARWKCGDATTAFVTIDRWLAAVEADGRNVPLEQKIREDRPPEAVDSCWINGQQVTDLDVCNAAFPHRFDPRVAAGEGTTSDVMKCQLKPLNRNDNWGLVPFTDDEWARLQAAFPTGVCDYSRPGVDQQPPLPWMTFAGGPGGEPLGPAPQSEPVTPTAVVVSGLRATRTRSGVLVRWRAAQGGRVLGFNLYRERVRLNRGVIAGAGRSHAFLDRGAPARPSLYRLEVVGLDGRRSWFAVAG